MYFEAAWFCKGQDMKGENPRNLVGEGAKVQRYFQFKARQITEDRTLVPSPEHIESHLSRLQSGMVP